jgi:hypothetical protein
MLSVPIFNIRFITFVGLVAIVVLAVIITIPHGVEWTPKMQERAEALAKEVGDGVVIQREGGGSVSVPLPPPGPPQKPKCQSNAQYGWKQLTNDLQEYDAIFIKDAYGGIYVIRKMASGEILIAAKNSVGGYFRFVSLSDAKYLDDLFKTVIEKIGWSPRTASSMITYLLQPGTTGLIPTSYSQADVQEEMLWDWEADCP